MLDASNLQTVGFGIDDKFVRSCSFPFSKILDMKRVILLKIQLEVL